MRLDPPPGATSLSIGVAEPQDVPAIEAALEDLQQLRIDRPGGESVAGGAGSPMRTRCSIRRSSRTLAAGSTRSTLATASCARAPNGNQGAARSSATESSRATTSSVVNWVVSRTVVGIELDAATPPDGPVDGEASGRASHRGHEDGAYGDAQLPGELVGGGVAPAAEEADKLLAPPVDVHGLRHYGTMTESGSIAA